MKIINYLDDVEARQQLYKKPYNIQTYFNKGPESTIGNYLQQKRNYN